MHNYCIIPDRDCREFWKFVDNLAIANKYKDIIKRSIITRVEVNTAEGTWDLFINLAQPLPSKVFDLAAQYLSASCGLKRVTFHQTVGDLDTFLTNEWPKLVAQVSQGNQAIAVLLGHANYHFDGYTLTIEVEGELSAEMLISKKIDKSIRDYILYEFGQHCQVKFFFFQAGGRYHF